MEEGQEAKSRKGSYGDIIIGGGLFACEGFQGKMLKDL
jgi:hypothetical protein